MASIGFIGLGNVKGGHSLKVFDLNEEAVRYVAQSGAKGAASAAEAATDVDFVISMVPVGADVRRVFVDSGVMKAARKGAILIDSSTIDVDTARAMHEEAAKAGLRFLDAPVSGGTTGADAATLTFMCGGDKATFAEAKPILEKMGKNIVHCGGPGQGQVVKMCNNMVSAVNMMVAAEAMIMGEKLGVDRKILYDVITTSTGSSNALIRNCPIPGPVPNSASSNGWKPGFMAKLMLKDLRLSQMAAASAGASTPLGAAATAAYAMHVQNGNGDLDSSSIIKLLKPDVK